MKQRVIHGAIIDAVTPDELYRALAVDRHEEEDRVIASAVSGVIVPGITLLDVYKVPVGCNFEVRRVMCELTGLRPPDTSLSLTALSGVYMEYLRSGKLIEYGAPLGPFQTNGNLSPTVPGVQSWSREQGPYLQNGVGFQVRATGFTAGLQLTVTVEGILTNKRTGRHDRT